MTIRRRKASREKDLTGRYLAGDMEDDRIDPSQRFSQRNKSAEQNKIDRTSALRAADNGLNLDLDSLPIGEVTQVYSLYCDVDSPLGSRRCVVRKTLNRRSESAIIVGDKVRFRETAKLDELGIPEGVVEDVLPRQTVLTRTDSFSGRQSHPIVANAQQMLIVVSVMQPAPKWGLVDRMLVAAQSGGMTPILCLNKVDLGDGRDADPSAAEAIELYRSLGIRCLRTSVIANMAIDALRETLHNQTTVLAGHSGVGKSSLIAAAMPGMSIRIGAISNFNDKGRHTTSSARIYPLPAGGRVIDTPGVKMFGLWNVTRDTLKDFFPDVAAEKAPPWRVASFQRIIESLGA